MYIDILDRISCRNFVEVEGYVYFSNLFYNALFKVQLSTGKTVFLGAFEDEKLSEVNMHIEVFLKTNKIYFFPWRGRHIHIYNLKTQFLDFVVLEKESKNEKVLEDEYIFFKCRGNDTQKIRRLNLKTLKITEKNKSTIYTERKKDEQEKEFPKPELKQQYYVEHEDAFVLKKIGERTWYGFLPEGHQLLRYTEGADEFEEIPLVMVNPLQLEKHLSKVKAELAEALQSEIRPEDGMRLKGFLGVVKQIDSKKKLESNGGVGKNIWKLCRI